MIAPSSASPAMDMGMFPVEQGGGLPLEPLGPQPNLDAVTPENPHGRSAVEVERTGGASPRTDAEPEEDTRAWVKEWWERTQPTEERARFLRQYRRDIATVAGEDLGAQATDEAKQSEDASLVTTRHIYRNAIQSTAMLMPGEPEVEISPRKRTPQYDPTTGAALANSDGITWQDQAFAELLTEIDKQLAAECDELANVKAWALEAHHFEVAWLKTTWQRDYRADSLQEERLPDIQDQIAEMETLLERFERFEFTEDDADYARMNDLMETLEKQTELPVWRGRMVKCVAPSMVNIDPKVRRYEDWRSADWISQDFLMTRAEVTRQFKAIDPTELAGAVCHKVDGSLLEGDDARSIADADAQMPDRHRSGRDTHQDDILLVREIESRIDQLVFVLVEGVEFPVRKYRPERRAKDWFSYRPLVLNRYPGNQRFAGFSDTELQAKEQDRLNRIDTEEDEDCRKARLRGLFDKDVIEDDIAKIVNELDANDFAGVSFKGRSIAEAFIPLPGRDLNPALHATRRQTAMSNMRTMSSLPAAATGSTDSQPEFAEEVKVAMEGASALTQYRRGLFADALTQVKQTMLQLTVLEMSVDEVVEMMGPNAAAIWMEAPKEREAIYRRLQVVVRASPANRPGKKDTLEGIKILVDAALALQYPPSAPAVLACMAKVLELPIDTETLLGEDANGLAMQLLQAIMRDPNSVDPAVLQQLMQGLMPIVQQDIAAGADQAGMEEGAVPIPGPGAPPMAAPEMGAPGAPAAG